LKAAPAHAVSMSTPVVFTILDVNGKRRSNLGRYWKNTTNRSAFFVSSEGVALCKLGITTQMTNCMVTHVHRSDNMVLRFGGFSDKGVFLTWGTGRTARRSSQKSLRR
jgi:hypothetical protein